MGVWIETILSTRKQEIKNVTPFVGVWIETPQPEPEPQPKPVTPFVGVWIETILSTRKQEIKKSHPSWVCGLKQVKVIILLLILCHTLRGCVD